MNQLLQGQPAASLSGADPSMEDILASIRRILNDDDADIAAEAVPAAPPAAEPSGNVFLLDQSMIVGDKGQAAGPIVQAVEESPSAMMEHKEISGMESGHGFGAGQDGLVDQGVAAATSSVMADLAKAVVQRDVLLHRGGGLSLEDLIRDELRPQLKGWLDVHLQPIVERLVRIEIERVSRQS